MRTLSTCSPVETLKGYMIRERLGTPGVELNVDNISSVQ